MDVFEEIKKLLKKDNIKFKVMEHEPVFTSEEAAKARGTSIASGAKAMVLRSKGKFYMFVVSSVKKIDMKKAKNILGTKSLSFASPAEVLENCFCEVGAVPPFGNLFGMDVFVDKSILEQDVINFNAGRHERSIQMKSEDYLKVVEHQVEEFSA